ncbi:MAG: TRAP transporter substrate-binding protein [Chloroflexi bacterium]|nr:TRAP transporter substrate-binding protein [Chloroflexota bacterium]
MQRGWVIAGIVGVVALLAAACAPAQPQQQAPAAPAAKPAEPAQKPPAPAAQPAAPAGADKVYKIRIASCTPQKTDGMSSAWFLQAFADRIKERSKGQLAPEIHWAGTLYCEVAAQKAMLDGAVEIGDASIQNSGTFTKAYFVLDLPFLFKDADEEAKAVILGPFNKRLKELHMKDQPNALPLIYDINEGLRDVECNRKVLTPADMRGLKIRTTETPTDVAAWKAFGAIATPIAWAETYTAGTQNLIQCIGVTTGYWLIGGKHYEWHKHITFIDYQTQIKQMSMNRKFFDSLPADLQKIITDTAAEVEKEAVEVNKQYTDKWITWLKTEGKQEIHTLTPEQKKEWVDRGTSIWDQFKDKIPAGLLEDMQKYLQSVR